MKRMPLFSASSRASVVLPVPGAPQRISDGSEPPRESSWRRMRPSPTRWVWPTKSASERGRMRSAKGAPSAGTADGVASPVSPNRLLEFHRSMVRKGCIIIAEKKRTSDRRNHLDATFIEATHRGQSPIFPGKGCKNLHGNAVAGICVYLASALKPLIKGG